MENVFVVKFNVASEAYQALTELRQEPVTDNYTVSQACIVTKKDDRITAADQFDTGIETDNDTASGTLIGGLIGILGGPIGILLGASYGMMVGNIIDMADTVDNASLIEQVCGTMVNGETAMIALVSEKTPETFAASMHKFNTEVACFEAAEVAAEVEKADELERVMQKEAREQLREEKKEEFKKKVEEKRKEIADGFEKVKEKLS